MRSSAHIALCHLSKSFAQAGNQLTIVDAAEYIFANNHSYAIMGASGIGKSTLLQLVAGLMKPTAGQIVFNTINIHSLPQTQKQKFLRDTIGLVLQNPYLIGELTIIENIMLKGLVAGKSRRQCAPIARDLLEQVGLTDKEGQLPATLSGGQQQRVALARALFNTPAFLLADELTGNLDDATGAQVIDILLACQHATGMGVIITTHDHAVAQRMDTVLELKQGKLHILKSRE